MIKINKRSKTKKTIFISLAVILLVIAGALAFAYSSAYWPFENNLSKDSRDHRNDGVEKNYVDEKADKNNKDQAASTPSTPGEDKVTQPGNSVSPGAAPETPTITRAEQSGDYIRVSVIFNTISNGKCILKLEKSGFSTLTKEASIVVGPSYYTCNGFRFPKTELPAYGEWSATVTHELNGKTATSERKAFNVQ